MNEKGKIKSETKKSTYISLNEWIVKMKTTFENAKQSPIFEKLQPVGYTEARLTALLGRVAALENLCEVQKMEQAEQNAETRKFNEKKDEIGGLFLKHRGLAKILFKKNLQAQVALNLNTSVKTAYAEWLRQVSNFYSQISKSPELIEEVKKIGITQAFVKHTQKEISSLSTLKESQKKETAEAQASTENRDQAFDALYEEYAELIAYAKILLNGDQALEMLGIVVRR